MIHSRIKRPAFLVLGAIVLLAAAYSVKSFTPPIFAENSVAELRSLMVNGDEQFLLIRGTDRNLPVILFLHGGPGKPAMYLAHDFQRELEKDFVVVHWDQRASGKSFNPDTDPERLSTSSLLGDTDIVVDFLRDRFERERIWLIGHSHGSYLGVLYARRNDEKVCAFVGLGQVTNDTPGGPVAALQTGFLESRREELGLGPDAVIDDSNLENLLFKSGSELYGKRSFAPLLLSGLLAPEYSLSDILNVAKGSSFSSRYMRYDMPRDLIQHEWEFKIPVALIMGTHDMVTPTELARQYFERIEAPRKTWYQFEEAAHFPHFEQPEKFAVTMSEIISTWGGCPQQASGRT